MKFHFKYHPMKDDLSEKCYRCAYDLCGIDKQATCPECGLSVEQSARQWLGLKRTILCFCLSLVLCLHYLHGIGDWLIVAWYLSHHTDFYRKPLPEYAGLLSLDVAEFLFLLFNSFVAFWLSYRRRWHAPYFIIGLLVISIVLFIVDSSLSRYQLEIFERPNVYATWWWYRPH